MASHSGATPPPGSQPITVTRPSQLSAAECQLLTPRVVKLVTNLGLAGLVMSCTVATSPAQTASRLGPLISTPMSWQELATGGPSAGPSGTSRMTRAVSGASSGTSTIWNLPWAWLHWLPKFGSGP